MISVVIQTIQLLGRRVLLRINYLASVLMFSGLFQIIPMMFVLPLIRVVGRPERKAQGLPKRMEQMLPEDLASWLSNYIIVTEMKTLIFSVAIVALFLFGFQALIAKYTRKSLIYFLNKQSYILANKLFNNYLETDMFSYINPLKKIESGCDALASLLANAVTSTFAIMMFFVTAAILIAIYPLQGFLSVGIIIMASSLLAFFIQPKMDLMVNRLKLQIGKGSYALDDSMKAIKEIKLLGREKFFFNRYLQTQIKKQDERDLTEKLQTITAIINIIMKYLGMGSGMGIAVYTLPKEELAGFAMIFMLLVMKLNAYAQQVIQETKVVYQSLLVLQLHYKTMLKYDRGLTAAGDKPIVCTESIEFKDLYFRHGDSDEPEDGDNYEMMALVKEKDEGKEEKEEKKKELPFVLEGINFKIKQGQLIGLVGRNGSGKSTMLDLLAGLTIPTQGSMLLDGQKLEKADRKNWRQQINYVIQKPHIISETILYNVTLGLTEEEIDQQLLENALQLSMLDQVIKQLPQGLETQVGMMGTKISGGQAQRIALARALYQNRPVLFLDEATRAIDAATEAEIMEKIATKRGKHTIIIVTHRVQALAQCDTIFLLDDKKIVAEGSYDTLCETSELFRLFAFGKREKPKEVQEKIPSVA